MRGTGLVVNSFWHRWMVRRRGRKDGRKGTPSETDTTVSQFEKELGATWQQFSSRLLGTHSPRIQRLESERNEKIKALEETVKRCVQELRKYNAKKKQLGRDVTIHLSRKWYTFFLVLIVLGEFALNAQAFDVFGKSTLLTYLMALVVAVGIPVCAHFIGIWIKQWPQPSWATAAKVIASVGVAIGCLVGINIARQEYLASAGIQIGDHGAILQKAFLLINLFVFLTAVIMSYFSHDSDQELENLNTRTTHLEGRIQSLRTAIKRHTGEIEALQDQKTADLEELRGIMAELIHMYRRENVNARANRPLVYDNDPQFKDPPEQALKEPFIPEEEVDKILQALLVAYEGQAA